MKLKILVVDDEPDALEVLGFKLKEAGYAPIFAKDGSRAITGPHVGRVRITPSRVFIGVALLGSLGYLVYALTVRDANQIPLLATGAAILGVVFVALAVAGAYRAVRAAQG